MPSISRFRTYVIAGASACGGAILSYYTFRVPKEDPMITNITCQETWDYNWDRRDPSSLVKPSKGPKDDNRYNEQIKNFKSKATRHLFLIRHGHYNTHGEKDEDKKLTELGLKQALMTGQRLKDLSFSYNKLTHSTMTRAIETARCIQKLLPNVPVEECSLLREGSPIPPVPRGSWKPEHHFFRDGARIEAAFRKYFHRADPNQKHDSHEILVCHANVIRYFVCRALQFPPEAWLRFSLHHGSITWVAIYPNGHVSVRALGDAGCMPREALTTS